MGLAKTDFDVGFLMGRIEQAGAKAIKHGIEVMAKEGEEIAKIASDMAPVDTSDGDTVHLQDSIRSEVVARSGINGRSTVEVFVDPDAHNKHGTPVTKYGLMMHEGLAPFGSGKYHLGPDSQAKDGGRGIVGGKFMTRAFEERVKIIEQKLKALWIRQFGGRGSRGGKL